jgi:hypothetical protein
MLNVDVTINLLNGEEIERKYWIHSIDALYDSVPGARRTK